MEIAELPEIALQLSGSKKYEVEGNGIALAWKAFQPSETSQPQEADTSKKAVVFIPGWSITEQAKSIELLGKTFADYSQDTTYAVDTRTDKVIPNATELQAEAIRRFIEERGLEEITLVGNSLGGVEAIHLTALLQERNPNITIDGLVLFDSMSLYDQSGANLAVSYAKDMVNTRMDLRHPPQMKGSDVLADQNSKYTKDGIVETLKEVMRSHVRYPSRTLNEIQQMVKTNPHLGAVRAPIVMIQGAHDSLSNPARIIPNQEPDSTAESEYIKDIHEREKFLQEHVFTNSPYIRMIVPEKMGHHNVSYSRPESVARSSLYLLRRWHRQQPQMQSTAK